MQIVRIGRLALAVSAVAFTACSNDVAVTSPEARLNVDVAAAPAGTVLVLPTATANVFTNGWVAYGDRLAAVGLGSIATASPTPVLGLGSLSIFNSVPVGGWEVGALNQPNLPALTRMDEISELKYSTYTPTQTGIVQQQVALQFPIDYDVADSYTGFQGRLVYEPYHCGAVVLDTWQERNTLDGANTGCWWQTANPTSPASPAEHDRAPWVGGVRQTGTLPCPQSNPCTWTEVRTAYPAAGFRADPVRVSATAFQNRSLILKVGSSWTGTFYADKVIVGVSGVSTTYDFEPYDVATTFAECTKDGWMNVTRADGSAFKNQGDCVSYIRNGK